MSDKQKEKPKYWYEITYYECPVCGRGGVDRVRKYTQKPEKQEDRVHFEQQFDYCIY